MTLVHLRRHEFRPSFADHAEHRDPVQQFAANVSRLQELLTRLSLPGRI